MKIQKIKTTFLIFSGLIILSFSVFTFAEENSSSNKNIFMDSDQDGLTNDEEKAYGTDSFKADTDGDGYSDGVEVKSGYNPLKPAPGDKIIATDTAVDTAIVAGTSSEKKSVESGDDKNLTKELAGKIDTLLDQSKTEGKGIKIEDLDTIIDEITASQLTFEDLPEIDESKIKIKKQEYSTLSDKDATARKKDDALKYLTAVGYIIATNSPQTLETEDDVEKIYTSIIDGMTQFSDDTSSIPESISVLADKGKVTLEQMESVEVPESFLDFHVRGLQLAQYAISLEDTMGAEKDDPIASMVSLSKVSNFLYLTEAYVSEVSEQLLSLGVGSLNETNAE